MAGRMANMAVEAMPVVRVAVAEGMMGKAMETVGALAERMMQISTTAGTPAGQGGAMVAIPHPDPDNVMAGLVRLAMALSREAGKRRVFFLAAAQRAKYFPARAEEYADAWVCKQHDFLDPGVFDIGRYARLFITAMTEHSDPTIQRA